MTAVTDFLRAALERLTGADLTLLVINVLLLVLARPILNFLTRGDLKAEHDASRIRVFRTLNIAMILFLMFYRTFLPIVQSSWFTRILGALVGLYLSYLGYHVLSYLIRRRFGRAREIDGEKHFVETYNTRALSLLTGLLAAIVALIGVVRILGFESLLEAGGVIGFLGVMLALTQGAWAPDIISGLIILNSGFMEEGDVIQMDRPGKRPIVGVVFRIKMFYTEILNVANNHRVIVRNTALRDEKIHNLSRFASARGLREELRFQIGYDVPGKDVEAMVAAAYEIACQDEDLTVSEKHAPEVRLLEAGDFAILWGVYFYLKDVRNVLTIRQKFRRLVVEEAGRAGIRLATPRLHVLESDARTA